MLACTGNACYTLLDFHDLGNINPRFNQNQSCYAFFCDKKNSAFVYVYVLPHIMHYDF